MSKFNYLPVAKLQPSSLPRNCSGRCMWRPKIDLITSRSPRPAIEGGSVDLWLASSMSPYIQPSKPLGSDGLNS
jgi:hypothetical protein